MPPWQIATAFSVPQAWGLWGDIDGVYENPTIEQQAEIIRKMRERKKAKHG